MTVQKHNLSKYGWHRDLPDQRDRHFSVPALDGELPQDFSLRDQFPPVYDQLNLGSCTANSVGGVFEFAQGKQGEQEFTPSRLFIYYNERAYSGQTSEDCGSSIRLGIQSLAQYGVAPETEWPYDVNQFSVKPPDQVYQDALKFEAVRYARVAQSVYALQATLASGYPVAFGFTVYENFESPETARTGIMTMPSGGCLGGHAVALVGYSNSKVPGNLYFEVRNSWGPEWGDQGYFWMPAAYIIDPNLASDFWVLDQIS